MELFLVVIHFKNFFIPASVRKFLKDDNILVFYNCDALFSSTGIINIEKGSLSSVDSLRRDYYEDQTSQCCEFSETNFIEF